MRLKAGEDIDPTLPESYDGSYIWLANNEMYFGGMGNLTFNTNNVKIQTKKLSAKTNLAADAEYNDQSTVD